MTYLLTHTVLLPYEITLFSNAKLTEEKGGYVLLPYEITLFSNKINFIPFLIAVLLPYEITLFSNGGEAQVFDSYVLLPYEITLFSNNVVPERMIMQFYYLMKLHYSQTCI